MLRAFPAPCLSRMLRYVHAFALNWADARYSVHAIIQLRLRPQIRLPVSQHSRAELRLRADRA
jgi:hypothetical protein